MRPALIDHAPAPEPDRSCTASDMEPCFTLRPAALITAAAEFRTAFVGALIYYAMKANPHPAVVLTLAELGCGFEAASWGEIELLLALGVDPSRVIYGTAVKPPEHVRRAVAAGVTDFAADSIEELEMLAALAPKSRVFVRVNADDSSAVFRLNRKFGAPLGQAATLVRAAVRLGLDPWGLSFNVGSQVGRSDAWAEAAASLSPVLTELLADGIELEVLNIGGGYPEAYGSASVPSLQEIAEKLADSWRLLPYAPRLLIEPGRRLVARSMELEATVIARVERLDGTWLFLDCGVYNGLFEALSCQGVTRYPVSLVGRPGAAVKTFKLAGPTGDSLDVISEAAALPGCIVPGDRLRFERVGAYTLSVASQFNGFPVPPVHVLD